MHCFKSHIRIGILLAIMAPAVLFAQFPEASPPVWNYTIEDGLPSNEVYHIHQDRQGYLWFATDRGVSRFDGYQFKNYGRREGLNDLVVFQILEKANGQLVFYTLSHQIFFLEGDSLIALPDQQLLDSLRIEAGITSPYSKIDIDRQGQIYLHNSYNIFRFEPEKRRLFATLQKSAHYSVLDTDIGLMKSLLTLTGSRRRVKDAQKAYDKMANADSIRFLFRKGTSEKQVFVPKKLIQNRSYGFKGSECAKWSAFKTDTSGYLISYLASIIYFKDGKVVWMKNGLPNVEVIKTSENGAVYVGLLGNQGLRKYATIGDIPLDRYTTLAKGYSVSYVHIGHQGELWVSTQETGVFCYPPFPLTNFRFAGPQAGNFIEDIAVESPSRLFFTNKAYNLCTLDIKKQHYSLQKLPYNNSAYLHWSAGTQALWIAGATYLQEKLNSGRFKYIFEPRNEHPILSGFKKIYPVYYGQPAILATSSYGLHILSRDSGHFLYATIRNNLRTSSAHQTPDGRIWLGSMKGLLEFRDSTLIPVKAPHPASGIRINALCGLPDSSLVIGTQGKGVIVWKDNQFKNFTQKDGLASDQVEALHTDEQGGLWVGTRSGLSRMVFFPDGKYRIRNLTTSQGLPSNQINVISSSGDYVWIGTAKGLSQILVSQLDSFYLKSRVEHKPLIQEVIVNNEVWNFGDSLERFTYDQNNLIIQFTLLDYLQRGNIRYRYRSHAEAPWINIEDRTVNLLALPPGLYSFEVQAQLYSAKGKIWSPSGKFNFEILPPFWQTTWFRVLGIVILAGLIFGAFRWYVLRLKERATLERKLIDLERSALQAQMNPHFIFNALNSIQGFINSGDKKNATVFLAKFAQLIRSTLNFSRQPRITLEDEIEALTRYLELERMRSGDAFDFEIHVDEKIDAFDTTLPPMLIQPFIENAIIHGIGPSQKPGKIVVHFKKADHELLITVRDNGIGINQSLKAKGKTEAQHQSLGMGITNERLAILNKTKKEQHVQVRELTDENGAVSGTEVFVRIRNAF